MAVETFLLVMLTMNARTGELIRSSTLGEPFPTFDACMRDAMARGPQYADHDHVQMLVCRSSLEQASKDGA